MNETEPKSSSYVVTDPRTREDLYLAIARAKSEHTTVTLELESADHTIYPFKRVVEMVPWASAGGALSTDSITGYFDYYLPSGEDSSPQPKYLITLSVPPWAGVTITATIMRLSDTENNTEEGGQQ